MREDESESLCLKVGRTYRGKKPRPAGQYMSQVNDRTLRWIGSDTVQYDGPAVADGRHYPEVSKTAFLAWADRDVTDELPVGEYAKWPPVPERRKER